MTNEGSPDQCPHCCRNAVGDQRCLNCGQSLDEITESTTEDDTGKLPAAGPVSETNRTTSRRALLALSAGSTVVLGAGGISLWTSQTDDSGNDDTPSDDFRNEIEPFGIVAENIASSQVLDGSVDANALSRYEVIEHIGIVDQSGPVALSARVRSVEGETGALLANHTVTATLYGPDRQELFNFGALKASNQSTGQDEILVIDFLGPRGLTAGEVSRYGLSFQQ